MLHEHRIWFAWGAVWLATRALIVSQVGFWNDVGGVNLEDVAIYDGWVRHLETVGQMPAEESWQYPPGAAYLMLLVALTPVAFGDSFVATMLVVDLLGLVLIASLAGAERRDTGIWVWLLAMPLLSKLSVLRFDLVPTVVAMAALVVIHRRPTLFGALAGLGAAIKVWPAVLLLAEWDRRRLARAAIAALAVVLAAFLVAAIAYGDQSGFLDGQSSRGLQAESVGSTPWHLREAVDGEPPFVVARFGTSEIDSGPADAIAIALELLTLLVLAAAAGWWLLRERAIRSGRADLRDAAVSRDFVFAVVLALVVANKVLSPQFMIWLVGLAAVVLTAGTPRLARPAWTVLAATALTWGVFDSSFSLVLRNTALVVAALDAALAMAVVLRRGAADAEVAGAALRRPW